VVGVGVGVGGCTSLVAVAVGTTGVFVGATGVFVGASGVFVGSSWVVVGVKVIASGSEAEARPGRIARITTRLIINPRLRLAGLNLNIDPPHSNHYWTSGK